MKLYKTLGRGGVSCNGGRGRWFLPKAGKPGKWMPPIEGKLTPCINGYHLCRFENLLDWLSEEIYEAEGRGGRVECEDKIVFSEAHLIRKIKNWNDKTGRLFAADCAEHVLHIYEKSYPNDFRSRNAIQAARDFANGKITRQALTAARGGGDATWATWAAGAAQEATGDAAWAVRDAAWAARAARAAWEAARAARDARDVEKKWQLKKLAEYLGREP